MPREWRRGVRLQALEGATFFNCLPWCEVQAIRGLLLRYSQEAASPTGGKGRYERVSPGVKLII